MSSDARAAQKTRQTLLLAQVACLAFGAGLLVWGLTPIILQRLTSRGTPELERLAFNSVTLLLGATFIGLCVLVGRGVRWALWTSVSLSTVLVVSALGVSVLEGTSAVPLFPVVLASSTALTSWLALMARKANAQTSQPIRPV